MMRTNVKREKVDSSTSERFGAVNYQRMRLDTTQGRANAEQDEECSSIRTQIPLSGLSECGGWMRMNQQELLIRGSNRGEGGGISRRVVG